MIKISLYLLFSIVSITVFGQIPFYDGFETGNFTTGGWQTSGNIQVSTQSPAFGTYCAMSDGPYGINKTFNVTTDSIITLEFLVKVAQTNVTSVIFRIKDGVQPSANTGPGVIFKNTGEMIVMNGTNMVSQMQYQTDKWYEFKIEMHLNSKMYNLYLDNKLQCRNYNFYSVSFSNPVFFTWSCIESGGIISLDEFRVYSGNANVSINQQYSEPSKYNILYDPFDCIISLVAESDSYTQLILTDMTGKILISCPVANRKEYMLSNLTHGIYIASLVNKGQVVFYKKIIL